MRGFTLIELIIVITILGILAGVAQPLMVASVVDARLRAAAGDVVTVFQYARAVAINTGVPTRVVVEANDETFAVQRLTHANIDQLEDVLVTEMDEDDVDKDNVWAFSSVDHPVNPGVPYVLDLEEDDDGIVVVSAAFGTPNEVTFDALGNVDTGGTITIRVGGRDAVISLDGQTGTTSVDFD